MTVQQLESLVLETNLLEDTLKSKAPALHTKFANGATDEDIDTLRVSMGGKVIESLETWFRWHNGGKEPFSELLPLGELVSIQESIAHREMMLDIWIIDELRKDSVMILHDGAGDGYFIETTTKSPRVFYHMLEDPLPRYYGTVPEFLNYIREGFTNGVFGVDEEGYLDYDDDQVEKLTKKHFP